MAKLWPFIVVLSVVFAVPVQAQDCGWQWVNSIPPQKNFYSMVAAQGKFVAVGELGMVATSVDGVQWTVGDSGARRGLSGIAYGDGQFVAVGYKVLLTGVDGLHWTLAASSDDAYFIDVAWGGGRWVVAADSLGGGQVLTSSDGQSWHWVDTGGEYSPYTVEWDGSRFVAISWPDVLTSPDGLTWEIAGTMPLDSKGGRHSPEKAEIFWPDLAFDGERYYLSWYNILYVSTDLTSWTEVYDFEFWKRSIQTVYAEPGILIVGGVGKEDMGYPHRSFLFSSTDGGQSWSWPFGFDGLYEGGGLPAIARNGSTFAAAGAQGAVFLSADGVTWSCEHGPCDVGETKVVTFSELDVSGPTMLALGGNYWGDFTGGYHREGLAAVSADGVQWQHEIIASDALEALAWSGTTYVGARGNTVARSSDGLAWEVFEGVADKPIFDLAFGNGLFVASGYDGLILTSSDGETWIERVSGTDVHLGRVFWDGTRFLAFGIRSLGSGSTGIAVTSPNGIDWTVHDLGARLPPRAMRQTGTEYLGVGSDEIKASQDGLWWETVARVEGAHFNDLAWNGELFVAVGFYEIYGWYGPVALVAASRDGRSWTRFTPLGAYLRAVEWTGNEFLAVGSEGSMLRATCVGVLAELAPTGLVLQAGETRNLTLTLSQAMATPVTIQVESSNPDVASVPETVEISPGSRTVSIPVHGVTSGQGITVSVVLPQSLGGGMTDVDVTVVAQQLTAVPALSSAGLVLLLVLLATIGAFLAARVAR